MTYNKVYTFFWRTKYKGKKITEKKVRTNQAVLYALEDAMNESPDVILMGEDIAAAGGPWKTSDGLLDKFGPERVIDTPIAEMGFMGMALGAACTGLRPVVEIMFVEFLGVAIDQLSTEAAKFRYLSGGELTVPLVVRATTGAGLGFGAQHSQTLESWFYSTPGLKLAVVSNPQSAYGLLRSAINDNNPVVILEPRSLFANRDELIRGEEGIVPLGKAKIINEGSDVTIVGLGSTVESVKEASKTIDASSEVIDLLTLIPWDRETIVESVKKTGRLVTVEENPFSGGWGSEIISYVTSKCYKDLKAPPFRITAPDTHIPFNEALEKRYLPSVQYIEDSINKYVSTNEVPQSWWEELEV